MHTSTEENYLKAIYHLSTNRELPVNTSAIAESMSTTSASVTDMLKRLAEKDLINYEKYRGVKITSKGEKVALNIIRKHRLWEVFLTQVLKFDWDEVHSMAEELEHVSSNELIYRLDAYLGHPKFDPHGDPIPDHLGILENQIQHKLLDGEIGKEYIILGVSDHTPSYLKHLGKYGLKPGITLRITEIHDYDKSMEIQLGDLEKINLSKEVSKHILVNIYG